MVYYHMLLDIYLMVRRKTTRLTCRQITAIALLPRSLGGLGVPSQMMLSITTERPKIESFFHTAAVAISRGSAEMGAVVAALLEYDGTHEDIQRGLVKGDHYTTRIPKIDPS